MKHAPALAGVLAALLSTACDTVSPIDPVASRSEPTVIAARHSGSTAAGEAARSLPLHGRFEGAQSVTVAFPLATVEVAAAGVATGLGRFTIELPHTVNLLTSTAQGTATLVAANGDVLYASFTGQAQVGPIVHIVESATITGGTGRFAEAAGSFTIERVFDPAAGRTHGSFVGTVSAPHAGGG